MERDTPQPNSLAEQGFTFISSKTRTALNAANIPQDQRYRLFSECAMTMTKLDWLNIVEIDGVIKTRFVHFGYGLPKFAHYLNTWGEAGTIKNGKVGKTGNRGATCMFIGYINTHEGDCYRMRNPVTNRVGEMSNVIFIQRMY